MSKNVGWVLLLEPDHETVRRARVLLVQNSGQYWMCPLWREAPNRLVPISSDKNGKMYIDASDPFSYELGSAPTLKQRISEFNDYFTTQKIPVKIVKLLTEDDLMRAGISCFTMEADPPIEELKRMPLIRMYV